MIDLIYETFDKQKHDVSQVAKLVYDVDYRTFDMFFKSDKDAIDAISKYLSKKSLNNYFKVILDENNKIIGYVSIYLHDDKHEFHWKSPKLFLVDILDHFVLCDIEEGDLYLAEVAIDESQRGCGLGRKVVCDVINYARSKNYSRVILDADFRNKGAKKLYESIGFKEFNKKRVKIGSFERGMHNMEFSL
ncbi:GNAT family N-acetyltransferase [uncultured Methanobrevibacter sp.]|uniref:GNAT family N-acetyltransferase n=1 Tax=uncultured Methanobrevibacter sp. TaxID=253161 RepID=UPI00260C76D6|nr:GNAT family N-acetyltransferase [uncultured Methanobrevibacter sp.]